MIDDVRQPLTKHVDGGGMGGGREGGICDGEGRGNASRVAIFGLRLNGTICDFLRSVFLLFCSFWLT